MHLTDNDVLAVLIVCAFIFLGFGIGMTLK